MVHRRSRVRELITKANYTPRSVSWRLKGWEACVHRRLIVSSIVGNHDTTVASASKRVAVGAALREQRRLYHWRHEDRKIAAAAAVGGKARLESKPSTTDLDDGVDLRLSRRSAQIELAIVERIEVLE